jgi:hypothetical protein
MTSPRRVLGRVGGAFILALVAVSPAYSAAADNTVSAHDRQPAADHVVFIGLDGFDVEYLNDARCPTSGGWSDAGA